jgi:ribosomal protein S30
LRTCSFTELKRHGSETKSGKLLVVPGKIPTLQQKQNMAPGTTNNYSQTKRPRGGHNYAIPPLFIDQEKENFTQNLRS